MKPKKGSNDARGKSVRRYNPEKNPYPTRKDFGATGNPLPVGNSRQQRRQRAKLTFEQQRACAQSAGFQVPASTGEVRSVEDAARWIELWEGNYARL